eukprot:CAMPEP_0119034956 /NCGR_PEP_ID=MMETSP1177-20130426/1962_1 /TAXON_ID=2985 /ORGANISM="Ochromonas sp, Strain CCMP1899" /LENGTH=145 /DNA_ID=CAMNT_0006992799 /DNA_START=117 /DNA_END=554 /DNA_ORIENTATION=+
MSTPASEGLVINFCTPHQAIYVDKIVDKAIVPGEGGEYGITAGHSPIISQLKAGLVTFIHLNGDTEKFFVSGGFSVTHKDSLVTDVSVTEAVPLEDLDESAIKAGHAEAMQMIQKCQDGTPAFAEAQIQADTYTALGRAVGLGLA